MSKFSDDDLEDFSRIGEVARLTALLSERDAEIESLKVEVGEYKIIVDAYKRREARDKEWMRKNFELKQQLKAAEQEIAYLDSRISISNNQLAASQQECERLKALIQVQTNTMSNMAITWDRAEIRKQTAREIVEMLRADRWAESELEEIKSRYGLEGEG